MTLANILKNKKINKDKIIKENIFFNNKLPIWLIKVNSKLINTEFLDALKILPANFILDINIDLDWKYNNISINNNTLLNSGYDFVVCSDCENVILNFTKDGVIPIVWRSNNVSWLLTEFNAAKIEGNAFIFENNALCDIYYAIIRYTENYKFPYDNKALVKNILDI